ncbi:hypothetical protein DENSPDRAFT_36206 [Dentipellis sp. KUC8613]|nr:hypothetical protein DENSPDRAFT_36206 [Dentipellis sp. KUC8613]
MMSIDVSATPRPRPPAKARQTSSQYKGSPPPPYVLPLSHLSTRGLSSSISGETILGSPISVTAQLVRSLGGDSPSRNSDESAAAVEEWLNERSREELSDLLLTANGVIRAREQELSLTSDLCKNLYNGNVTLKSKHQALLARLPAESTTTPITSPAMSIAPTPHVYTSSLPRSTAPNPSVVRHARRISVSPSDIAQLSDQNAELMSKVEMLERESSQADQLGRRKLKKLEKEIQTLREELDASRARSDELEQQVRLESKVGKDSEEALQKKHEREERVKALRKKQDADEVEEPMRDFAPGSAPVAARTFLPPLKMPATPYPPSPRPPKALLSIGMGLPSSLASSPNPMEYGLLSQLLAKVRELEQTNEQITEQQRSTTMKLREAQSEVEAIGQLYACLDDDAHIEFQAADEDQPTARSDTGTMRFRSLRRSIGGGITRSLEGAVLDEDPLELVDTVRGSLDHKDGTGRRSRKSIIGFFDPSSPEAASPAPATHSLVWTASSSDPSSPTLSSLDLPASSFPLESTPDINVRRPTLGSELGSEFGDDSPSVGNHHLRSTSLYDIIQFSPLPSPLPSPSPAERPLQGSANMVSFPTQTVVASTTALQLALDQPSASETTQGSNRTPNKSTYGRTYRLSETVRSRTGRWVDRRFGDASDSPLAGDAHRAAVVSPKGNTAADRFNKVFSTVDAVVETFTSAVASKTTLTAGEDKQDVADGRADDSVDTRQETHAPAKKHGLTSVMLELWLWLQFAVIVLVFLWAMAKRGPKSVLDEADRRRTSAAGRR